VSVARRHIFSLTKGCPRGPMSALGGGGRAVLKEEVRGPRADSDHLGGL
jgi:hypothetical protein